MADDVKDVAIYTGSEWTSLSELAAGVVDAKLPIESVDGSVTLQSPEVNKYQIIVGGASRVDVGTSDITFRDSLIFSEWQSKGDSPSKITLDAQATINVGGKVFNVASNESDLAEGDGGVYAYNRTGVYSVISNGIHFNSNAAGGVKSVSWKMDADGSFAAKTATQSIQCANYRGQSPNELNGLSVSDVVAVTVDGENKLEISSEAVKCRDAVWCDTFLPYNGAGAKLSLSSNALWTIDTKLLEFTSNTGGVAGGSGLYVRNRTDDLAFVSDEIRFNSNASGGVLAVNWVMDTKGDLVAQTSNQEIECTNYRGQGDNTDNGFTIDSSVKVTVNGDTRLNISSSAISAWPEYEPSGLKDLVTREYCDNAASPSALPISSTDDTVKLQSPAADEFEVELAGEMKLRITADDIQASPGYQPRSDTSLVTKRFLYGQNGGSTPIVPPGQNSGVSWQTRVIDQSGYSDSQVRLQNRVLACDGIFTIGPAWSANGVDWFESGSGAESWTENPISGNNGHFIVKGDIGMYMSGSGFVFSYNMKNWVPIINAIGFTNNSPVIYWNNDFYVCKLDTTGGNADDDSGRIPVIRSSPKADQGPYVAFSRFDYSTGRWTVTRKEAEIWFAGQTARLDKLDSDDLPDIRYTCSKPDGTMTLCVQSPFKDYYTGVPSDTASRLCYIKPNANQDIDSENNAYQASLEVIPQFSDFDAQAIQGIAYHEEVDRWVFITESVAYSCQGNPATATWRPTPLPVTANWSEGFHHNGIEFIATAKDTNANIGIYSADGLNWQATYDIETNSEYTACGTNGRSILSGISVSLASTFTYAITPVHVDSLSTSDVNLTEPVATTAAYTQRTGRATLTTQEDANIYFNDAINLRAFVVTLTQADYDAIPSDQLDDKTLYCITD